VIEEEHLVDHRAGDGGALLLAAGKALATFLHADEAPRMLGPLLVRPFLCTVAFARRSGMLSILSALGLKSTI
jgi:hypothetical protein